MPEHCCDYTRPGVDPWWVTGDQERQAEAGGRETPSAEPRDSRATATPSGAVIRPAT